MDVLIDEESPTIRRFILSLLTSFGERVIPETLRRLEDSRWFVKRNMIFILMDCGNDAALKKARPCCDHENPKVSFEAIKCLLKAGDDYGVTVLKKYLNSESQELAVKAVMLAGSYRVRGVVPDLVRKLRKKAMSGNDFEEKIPVVRALGQIGDPGVLDILNSIQSSRSFLFKGALEKLKAEIRTSLKNYTHDRQKTACHDR
jgi:HEAT repeat protein